jgi:hypothetical protein
MWLDMWKETQAVPAASKTYVEKIANSTVPWWSLQPTS